MDKKGQFFLEKILKAGELASARANAGVCCGFPQTVVAPHSQFEAGAGLGGRVGAGRRLVGKY